MVPNNIIKTINQNDDSTSSITVSTSYLGDDYDNPKYDESLSSISSSLNISNITNHVDITDDYDDDDDDNDDEDDGVNRMFVCFSDSYDTADDLNDFSKKLPYNDVSYATRSSSSTPSLPFCCDYDDDDNDDDGNDDEDDGVNQTFVCFNDSYDTADDPNDFSKKLLYDDVSSATRSSSGTPSLPLLSELIRQRQFNSIHRYIERYPEDLALPLSSSLTNFYSPTPPSKYKENNTDEVIDDNGNNGPRQTLPFHYLVSLRPFPPHSIVRAFINGYPPAVSCRETMWGYLPLHLACRHHPNIFHLPTTSAPTGTSSKIDDDDDDNNNDEINRRLIIRDLLDIYPIALRLKESFRGMLPLHLAVDDNEASPIIVELLIRAFPKGVLTRDDFGYLPIHVNVHRGSDDAERQRRVNNMLRCVMNEFDENRNGLMMSVNSSPVIDEGHGKNEDDSILSSEKRGGGQQRQRRRRRFVFHLSGYHLSKTRTKRKLLNPFVPLGKCKSSHPWSHPKKPNPYFEFYVKRRRRRHKQQQRETKTINDTNNTDKCIDADDSSSSSSSYWKLVYKPHPLFNTSSPTWNNISIDLTPNENEFKITLRHCDINKKCNMSNEKDEDDGWKWGSIETSVSELTEQKQQQQQPKHCRFFRMTEGTAEAMSSKKEKKIKETILGIANAMVIFGDK